ncbi:tetratricopeptide repeat protein [Phycicoccus sp.]|uniref:tetratricopeptide repeat protein n=1 Tax=Phycicoccus sp. TaxID=1902410 RepID=UPI002BDDBDC8|nr:tetratricopeptide repeat protein [Phycicoccus sp.]HMM94647.1 tetratricopeptide repeat protein [Phycicoccus sp.]
MTQTPEPAGTRGAVDLSAVSQLTTPGAATGGGGVPAGGGRPPGADAAPVPAVPEGLLVEVTPATLQQALTRTVQVAGLLVLWSSGHPQTRQLVDTVARVAARQEGRVLVLTADLTGEPELLQAFQPLLVQAFGQPTVPATFGLLQGQPVPLFPGVADERQVAEAVDQLLQAAVQNGITGRVDLGPLPEGAEAEEEALSPLHEAAYEAIERGDLPAAATAYEQALAADPKDEDARLGLAQVRLMERTAGVDPQAARAAAAADPSDVAAACVVADLDVLGGHVEDAFTRLVDLVRTSAGEEREQARTHLLGLFDVVGAQDERVRKGRTALMSALF